jgi:hypothetical protein
MTMNNPESAEKVSSGSEVSSRQMNGGESDIFSSGLNYTGFLDRLREEGLKGKIKRFIFHFIGFFAWWQEQINFTIRNAIIEQQARIQQLGAQFHQQQAQFNQQEAQLRQQEAQLRRQEAQLTEQRLLVAKLNRIIEEFQQQSPGRNKRIEELEQKVSRLDLLENALYKELSEQKAEIARQRRLAG